MAVTTNDAANPFALDVKIVGAAALDDRRVILQTTDWNLADGGNVGVGPNTTTAKLAVAGVIESTSGGVKFPDGTTQTTAWTTPLCFDAVNRYKDCGDGTVLDQKTGLIWEKKLSSSDAASLTLSCFHPTIRHGL